MSIQDLPTLEEIKHLRLFWQRQECVLDRLDLKLTASKVRVGTKAITVRIGESVSKIAKINSHAKIRAVQLT
jgi:hypothetical protein